MSIFMFLEIGADYWLWHYYNRWTLLLLILTGVLCVHIARRTTWFLLPYLLSALLGSVLLFSWQSHSFKFRFPPIQYFQLMKYSAATFGTTIVGLLVLAHFPTRFERAVNWMLVLVYSLSVWRTWYQFPLYDAYNRGSFSGNASMNGSLIAALFPMVLRFFPANRDKILLSLLTLSTVVITGASVPLGVLFVVTLMLVMERAMEEDEKVLLYLALPVAVGLVGFYQWDNLIEDTGRFNNWDIILNWWEARASWSFGTGIGTGFGLFPNAQALYYGFGNKFQVFLFMHNDWLQILFETGYVGLLSVVATFFWLLCKAYSNPYLLASLAGFGAMAMVNYPLQLGIHAICLFAVVWLAIHQPTPLWSRLLLEQWRDKIKCLFSSFLKAS